MSGSPLAFLVFYFLYYVKNVKELLPPRSVVHEKIITLLVDEKCKDPQYLADENIKETSQNKKGYQILKSCLKEIYEILKPAKNIGVCGGFAGK